MARKLGYVAVPYQHPGFPDIEIDGPVSIFKKNAKEILDDASFEMDRFVQTLRVREGPKGSQLRKRRNAVRVRQDSDPNVDFTFFFDKAAYETISKDIRNEIANHFDSYIGKEVLDVGGEKTRGRIRTMQRAFKGKLKPNTAAKGDFYDTIAESLNFIKQKVSTKQRNQFTHYSAGSFDEAELTGVRGSRGANLIELIGMDEFEMESSPFGGTKRLGPGSVIGNLKGR